MITSRVEGKEEAPSAALSSVEGLVNRFIDAGVVQEPRGLFRALSGHVWTRVTLFPCSGRAVLDRHDAATHLSVIASVISWLVAAERRSPPRCGPDGRQPPSSSPAFSVLATREARVQ